MTEHVDAEAADAATRAAEQAARIAAIRARRGQTALVATEAPPADRVAHVESPPTTEVSASATAVAARTTVAPMPAVTSAPRSHRVSVAAGGKILVTGLTTSAVFGLTSVISAANRPTFEPVPVAVEVPGTTQPIPAVTTLHFDSPTTVIGTVTVPPLVAPTSLPTLQTIVLELPTMAPVNVPTGASGNTGGSGGSSAPATSAPVTATTVATTPPPAATTAPPVAPATPPPTTAAPTPTAPPAPPTTTAPSQ